MNRFNKTIWDASPSFVSAWRAEAPTRRQPNGQVDFEVSGER
ncbi:hypothetical protein [Variovorax fucosicus]|nr:MULTISPECIES: hypothetical protein [unclassified Variovorax]MDM0055359.1 hypothetical protein [Variovorax sp. J22G47]